MSSSNERHFKSFFNYWISYIGLPPANIGCVVVSYSTLWSIVCGTLGFIAVNEENKADNIY